jgi:hypothetical protein
MPVRRLDSLLPEAQAGDEFGQHAVVLMKRAAEIGYEKAIAEELANPTWDDPDWCRMTVARANGQVPVFPEDESVTFRCHRCRDTGTIMLPPIEKHGSIYQMARECNPCTWRMWAKAQWQKQQEREGRGGNRSRETF